jgi:proline iminopeptidase
MRTKVNGTEIYFDIDGAGLTVTDAGLRERPTVIALHGGPGFDQGYLRPGLGPLRDHAQVVYLDLRGQGRSGRPPVDTCTFEQMADDVAALCEQLGIARPLVLGHSAGGFVALNLAIHHPERVGGLILSNTTATMAPQDDGKPAPSLAERAGPEIAAIAQAFFGGDASDARLQEFTARVAPYYAGPDRIDIPGRMLSLSTLSADVMRYFIQHLARTYDVRPSLDRITAPTLIISGGHDWVCSPAGSRALARGIRGARLLEIPEAGHFSFAEQPEQFFGAVLPFLRER